MTEPTPSATARTDLSITLLDGGLGEPRTYLLQCDPTGGTHPDPDAACRAVAAVGAAGFDPVPADATCTQVYGGDQVARVSGTVDGTAVDATFTRTDGCEIARWEALAALLDVPGTAGG